MAKWMLGGVVLIEGTSTPPPLVEALMEICPGRRPVYRVVQDEGCNAALSQSEQQRPFAQSNGQLIKGFQVWRRAVLA